MARERVSEAMGRRLYVGNLPYKTTDEGLAVTVGTAGHIDHGKTWLVRALTGKDTDRLPEERRRGISIDLGFGYLPAPDRDDAQLGGDVQRGRRGPAP